MRALIATVALAGLASLGCEKTPEPTSEPRTPRPTATATAASTGASAATTTATGAATPAGPSAITWDTPEGWEKVDHPSRMRMATFKIPKAAGDPEDGELSVSQTGGSVDMNVQRWTGQFEKAKSDTTKRSEREVSGLKVTVVELSGTFTGSGMPGTPPGPPKENWAMLGAIVETAGMPHFFKLTGPKKTVDAAKPGFEKLLGSIRPR